MGQLSLSDIQYVLKVTLHIYGKTHEKWKQWNGMAPRSV
jgi:hypothetical protein